MGNSDYPQGLPIEEMMKLAGTSQGRALIAMLQQTHGKELETAIAQAQSGNYEQVKQTLSSFLASPSEKAILEQLRGNNHG